MSLIACLSGPESTRANVDVALEDNRIPHLPEKHHGMMDWTSKLPPYASDEAENAAKKRKHHGPQGFVTIHVADASELNTAVAAVEKHGWVLRVHYPEPDAPAKPSDLSIVERLERRITALEAQSARPPMMGGAMESPGFANQASSYAAEIARRAIFSPYARTVANTPGILAGGLLSATDMQMSAPGSGLSTNVSVGEAIVGGSEGGVQGGYYTRNASTTNLAIATANASNPRIDTVCVTIADAGYTEPTGVAGNAAVLQVVTGTATAGATLVNLNGKAALPLSSLLLGYVLVPATATNIITADIANVATTTTFQGLSGTGVRGAVSIATAQSTASTSFTTLATADQVAGLALPTNGLIAVWYQATWQESVQGTAKAAIFIGANQLEVASPGGAVTQAAFIGAPQTAATNAILTTVSGIGLATGAGSGAYTGDVTTGQIVGVTGNSSISSGQLNWIFGGTNASSPTGSWSGGGPVFIFATAGTYTISVRFLSTSGSVTASNRKLWVQALPFS